jgi:hypothetical protein
MAVNPKHRELDGVPVVATWPTCPRPELAVICTPPASVPGLIAALGERGTRAAIVMTAGLDAAQKQAMLDAARPHLLRILGPNCLGLLAPHIGLNASFAHIDARRARWPSSRSRARWSPPCSTGRARGIGFSHFVSLGEHADVDFGDMLDWLASDARRAPSCSTSNRSRRRASSCRRRARRRATSRCSWSRPGARRRGSAPRLAHRRAGRVRHRVRRRHRPRRHAARGHAAGAVHAAETLAHARRATPPANERLTILTNGGGAGVMAADAAARPGGRWPTLAPTRCSPAGCRAAGQLVARQPGGHHRRRPGRALRADAARRCWPTPAPARCCSCTRPPPSCPVPTSPARWCRWPGRAPPRGQLLAGRRRRGRGARGLPAAGIPATTRPSRRCAPARCWPPTGATRPADARPRRRARRSHEPDLAACARWCRGAGQRPRDADRARGQGGAGGLPASRWWPPRWSARPARPPQRRQCDRLPGGAEDPVADRSHKSDVGGVALGWRRARTTVRRAASGDAGARAPAAARRAGRGLHRAGHGAAPQARS